MSSTPGAYSELCQASVMEQLFAKIINGYRQRLAVMING